MENVVHIGAIIGKEDVNNLAEGIERIFKSGFENHMEQNTITQALSVFSRTLKVENITLSGSTFIGEDNTVTVNTGKEKKEEGITGIRL